MPSLYTPSFPKLPPLEGLRIMTGRMGRGSSYQGRDDIMLVLFEDRAAVAGVFTKSSLPAWPVQWSKRQLKAGKGEAKILLVNAGSANALSGPEGQRALLDVAKGCASYAGCKRENVFLASTGIIGAPLASAPLLEALQRLPIQKRLPLQKKRAAREWKNAAQAIMTTDRFPKAAWGESRFAGETVRLCAIAKGAGMIAPDMATTLAFVFTDAAFSPAILQSLLAEAVETSFNAISVDGDMSTNDTVMLFALGRAKPRPPLRSAQDPRLLPFKKSLQKVLLDLARQIVLDGEGTKKLLSIHVSGARNARWAKRVAARLAQSVILKAALAGGDPNWGRVAAAIGMTRAPVSPQKLKISFGGVPLYQKGAPVKKLPHAKLAKHMRGRALRLDVDLGAGTGSADYLGCDLTQDYLKLNAARS